MRYGVNTWVWGSPLTTETLELLAPKIAEMGYDVIELPLEDHSTLDYESAAEIVAAAGLDVTAAAVMTPERDLVHEDEAKRENGRAYLREAIEAVETLGGSNLVGPMYAATGRVWQMDGSERETTLNQLAETLAVLVDYADDRGVSLCVEPLNRFETSLVNTAHQGIDVVDRVDHDGCRLLLDSFHMNIEDKHLPTAIRRVGGRLGEFHACANDRGMPGTGHIDWTAVGDALDDIGFDGPVVVESFTPEVESIAKAASVWRPLADDQDGLARGGLANLRTAME